VYYSRTGNTERVGKLLAEKLGAQTEAIIDTKSRDGVLGFIGGGKDQLLGKETEIEPIAHDPGDYDLVVVGTPVWAGSVCPAVRAYLTAQSNRLPRVAFFLTTGGTGIDKTFNRMAEISGCAPLATLGLKTRDVKKDRFHNDVDAFVAQVRAALGADEAD
jgi:flavodoxin